MTFESLTNLSGESKGHKLGHVCENQVVCSSMCIFKPFIKSPKELTIHLSSSLLSFVREGLNYECYVCSTSSLLCIVDGCDDVVVDVSIWVVVVVFVQFLSVH